MTDYDDIPALRREESRLTADIRDAKRRLEIASSTPQRQREPLGRCMIKCDGCGGAKTCTAKYPETLAKQIGRMETRLFLVRQEIHEAWEGGA